MAFILGSLYMLVTDLTRDWRLSLLLVLFSLAVFFVIFSKMLNDVLLTAKLALESFFIKRRLSCSDLKR